MNILPPLRKMHSERLLLQNPVPDMARLMREALPAKELARLGEFLPWPNFPQTEEAFHKWIKNTRRKWRNGQEFAWLIFEKAGLGLVGGISIYEINQADLRGEIGYWLTSNATGKGYIQEAAKRILPALYKCGFHRIQAVCSLENQSSLKVLETLGFSKEGTLIDYYQTHGKFHSVTMLSVLEPQENTTPDSAV